MTTTIRHRLQTSHEVAPHHWVAARSGWYGTWDVVETTPGGSRVHGSYQCRADAETAAAALAATRTPQVTW